MAGRVVGQEQLERELLADEFASELIDVFPTATAGAGSRPRSVSGVLLACGMEREHHRNARHVGAIVNVDLARAQTLLELLAAHAQALACLFIYSLVPFLRAQLADFIVGSGSHCKRSLRRIGRVGRLLDCSW